VSDFNDVFVVSDSHAGTVTRFNCGGSRPVITHMAVAGTGGAMTFRLKDIEIFRLTPPEEFRVCQSPSGGVTQAAISEPGSA
jgi:hypothetical protein